MPNEKGGYSFYVLVINLEQQENSISRTTKARSSFAQQTIALTTLKLTGRRLYTRVARKITSPMTIRALTKDADACRFL